MNSFGYTIDELTSGDEFTIDRQKVRTYKAIYQEPELYSILFSNPDANVIGRQWITEIGVKKEKDHCLFSILLETSDISTQVREVPFSSRPKVIKYLQENCEFDSNTPGLDIRAYKNDESDFRALLSEIERDDRFYPIVLVSNSFENKPLVNIDSLQEQLFGLAQVVTADGDIDSWEMERIVGRRYSAWGGAVNVIFPIGNRHFCPRRLILRDEILGWHEEDLNSISQILSIITHNTNGRKKRNHFSPYDVRAKRQSDHRKYLKEKFIQLKQNDDYKVLLEEAINQIDSYDKVVDDLKNDHRNNLDQIEYEKLLLEDDLEKARDQESKLKYTIDQLKSRIENKQASGTSIYPDQIDNLVKAISHDPTPEECLEIISYIFSDKVEVLKSAFSSSKDSFRFKHSRKLISLLYRLSTEYIDQIKVGGDSYAKDVFGATYSANESETVERSPKLSSYRTFRYKNEDIKMFKHLKIGVADNLEETIRVHFHWDSSVGKVVIGYCGPHLPLS